MTALASDPAVVGAVRVGLALLFASAAWHKLRERAAFAGVLDAYRVLPPACVPVAAVGVALAEACVAVAWLVPAASTVAVGGAIALLATYSVAIAVNLARGRRTIDCGCGAPGTRQPIGEWLVARNAVLAGLAAWTLYPVAARTLVWVDGLTIAGAVAVAACAWTAGHGLAAAGQRTAAAGAVR